MMSSGLPAVESGWGGVRDVSLVSVVLGLDSLGLESEPGCQGEI